MGTRRDDFVEGVYFAFSRNFEKLQLKSSTLSGFNFCFVFFFFD